MIDPSMMKKIMKQLKMEQIEASRVVIETPEKQLIINNPSVQRMKIGGQDSFQISGEVIEEDEGETIEVTEDDIKLVMEQTGKSREKVMDALAEAEGDIAKAIMSLK